MTRRTSQFRKDEDENVCWETELLRPGLTPFPEYDTILLKRLQEENERMIGTIRCRGECPQCGRNYIHVKRLGFICKECKTVPKRYYLDLWHGGKRIRIYSDDKGFALDSYSRAQALQARIDFEVRHHTFDPSKYIEGEAKGFWTSNLLDQFLEHKLPSIAPSYQAHYRKMVKTAKGFFSTQDVREIRKLHQINYLKHLETLPIKEKTRRNYRDLFIVFMNYCCHDLEIIDKVPAFPSVEYTRRPAPPWIDQMDRAELVELVPAGDGEIFKFLMLHPIRPSEARALRCKCADLKAVRMIISASFSKNVYRERRKGRGAEPYRIPIHPECLDYITERVKNNLPEAYLFINPRTGGPYTEEALRAVWLKVRKRAGIGVKLYDCSRHSIASELLDSGSSMYKVSKLMGHSSVKTTEKYYAHLNVDSLRTDLEKLSLKRSSKSSTVSGLSLNKK